MYNNFCKIIMVGIVIINLAACSKKNTTTNNNSQNRPTTQRSKQPRGERPQFADLLAKMDQNKDGKLSISEAEGPMKNDFSKIDTNDDGFITEDEFKNAPRPQRRGRN